MFTRTAFINVRMAEDSARTTRIATKAGGRRVVCR